MEPDSPMAPECRLAVPAGLLKDSCGVAQVDYTVWKLADPTDIIAKGDFYLGARRDAALRESYRSW
jgi:hypothetical protein